MRSLLVTILLLLTACAGTDTDPDVVVITVIGTNDTHGELLPEGNRSGITTLSGYVAAMREIRADDGGVLLVSAGDMWQGTLDSNLSEGAAVVEAFNAMGYAAAAIGNHEFDFGPLGPKTIPEVADDDPQGALRRNAANAHFPLLAANLVDKATGLPVAWQNVAASTLTSVAGVDIGIIGLMTSNTTTTTIAANVANIAITPLADAATREARKLRAAGAELVVIVAHAGSECDTFDDPFDLSTCDLDGEIMQVAQAIPAGLVDHIVAGHRHRGIAHVVNGIAITAAYSNVQAFGRVDFSVDRRSGQVVKRHVHEPQGMCDAPELDDCEYQGRKVVAMPDVDRIARRARQTARALLEQRLGITLEAPIVQERRPEDALGNLFTQAVLEFSGADVSITNVWGGIRAGLPAGELTYGDVFRMFPFDNRIAVIELSGSELRRLIATQAQRAGRQAGFAGMRVFVNCNGAALTVRMLRSDGSEIRDDDHVRVAANDFLLLGGDGIFVPVTPPGGFEIESGTPLVRDAIVAWFSDRGGSISAADFYDAENPRWNAPGDFPVTCPASGS